MFVLMFVAMTLYTPGSRCRVTSQVFHKEPLSFQVNNDGLRKKVNAMFSSANQNGVVEKCEVQPNHYKLHVKGCEPKAVDRGMCYGHCVSTYVPGTKYKISSNACLPLVKKRHVKLECVTDGIRTKKKIKYYKIVDCKCKEVKVLMTL